MEKIDFSINDGIARIVIDATNSLSMNRSAQAENEQQPIHYVA
ncbi:MAG: hypothetical protein ACU85V_17255 [Gammaproteobacteria bacterium]